MENIRDYITFEVPLDFHGFQTQLLTDLRQKSPTDSNNKDMTLCKVSILQMQ